MYKLRDYQEDAVKAFRNFLVNEPGKHGFLTLPTGAGKSLVIAEVCRLVIAAGFRVLVLARQKELIVQNAEKLQTMLGDEARVGVFCAGLGRKEPEKEVVFATVQSCVNSMDEIGTRHLVIVDEAHQIPSHEGGQYHKVFKSLEGFFPRTRRLGLTATPFRLDSGPIEGKGQPFDVEIYRVSVARMLEEGHICPIRSKDVAEVDTESVRKTGWDFNAAELQDAFGHAVVENAKEIVAVANELDRRHCLVFASGVQHAEDLAELIRVKSGDDVGVVTGETLPLMRDAMLDRFKRGDLRWLVNCNVLTTGFDAPCVDLIAMVRATLSACLFAQCCGRGLRQSPGKDDCVLLDFGGNIRRHGPIDADDFGMKPKSSSSETTEAPTKECPSCNVAVPISIMLCPDCGFRFPPPEGQALDERADQSRSVLASIDKSPTYIGKVTSCEYEYHMAKSGIPTLRVDYRLEYIDEHDQPRTARMSEWVCLEHEGYAKSKAIKWWNNRSRCELPGDISEAVDLACRGGLREPDRLEFRAGKKTKWEITKEFYITDVPPPVVAFEDEEDCPF